MHIIVKKYEDMLEQLNKENKRLNSSLKGMVSTNRIARDQNKVISTELAISEEQIKQISLQLKNVELF